MQPNKFFVGQVVRRTNHDLRWKDKIDADQQRAWLVVNETMSDGLDSISGMPKQAIKVSGSSMWWNSDNFEPRDVNNDSHWVTDPIRAASNYAKTAVLSVPVSAPVVAEKQSSGKPPLDILFRLPGIADVARGFDYGATKYPDKNGDFNWRQGRGSEAYKRRLAAAALRHIHARLMGERIDSETKIPHLALAACNVLMMADIDILEAK